MNQKSAWRVFGSFAMASVLFLLTAPAGATELTLQNDSLADGQPGNIQAGFVAGESAASWFTSPCDGNVVAVQVFWRSVDGTTPISIEDSITILAAGSFPTPGTVLEAIVAPVLTDGAVNEYRFLDDMQLVPLIVPVSSGQGFVVSFKFANTPDILFGPSIVTDFDGCQSGSNAINAVPGGWLNACLLGLTGDFFIRAVVDCGSLSGACCEVGGGCSSISGAACSSAGGVFQGEGTNCGGVTCSEACCFEPSGCLDLTVVNCDIAAGLHQGPGTECATTQCFPTGACCNVDGTCDDDVLDSDCINSGGEFQGDGVLCSGVTCPAPGGACCLSSGGCLLMTMADCAVIPNSTWAGAQTDCTDADGSGIADDCEGAEPVNDPLPVDSGSSNDRRKNRFISFKPNNIMGQTVKLQVTLTASLPHPGLVNSSWWVQAVVAPGNPLLPPGECVALLGLDATAADIDWTNSGCDILHVTGCPIEPTSDYSVRAVVGADVSGSLTLSTIVQPGGGKFWGDTVGIFDGTAWTAPNGVTSIDDVVAEIKTWQGGPVVAPVNNTAHLSVADVDPGDINLIVNFNDVFKVVQAFVADPYPFGPAAPDGSCPP